MSDQRRSVNARRDSSPPSSRIPTPHSINRSAGEHVGRSRGETLAQQPRRLHRHAYSLGNGGMRFAGSVANKNNTVESTPPGSGSNRPGGQPVSASSTIPHHSPSGGF